MPPMHEMAIAQSILDIVRDEMAARHCTRLDGIGLECGALSGVEPESLRFCLSALLDGGPWADARLELRIVPLRLRCFGCGTVFGGESGQDALWQPCPQCGEQFGHTVEQGKELRISHLDAS
ncbi:hydrogenase maturation nickel metallochaperone HypA [uncultured Desulfovibrio sp.]|uniref:hydrogenase maturation nickel metallochaperone HypA/HybF n=1 Tax=uncultured Desulfovibrio sp. TaxID=167968 RepID=UPI00260B579D|nr:hydrogenase maturation nickel metallochaperone HypA [uncultured Desulfovibrio sp.]